RSVRGTSEERIFTPSGVVPVSAGGRQLFGGTFVEDILHLGRLSVSGGVRFDRWRNLDGHRTSSGTRTDFPDRSEGSASPRVSLRVEAGGGVSLAASGYRSFRAPTLNELYRNFRVGNVVTNANEKLTAERLTGAEAGAVYASRSGNVMARL